MKIFISWSGQSSQMAARVLRDWLKCVLNDVVPFVSSEDIRKGKRWLIDISEELANTSFGIICLTGSNLNSPWILFEAGALSKFSDAQVTALLLGDLTQTEVEGPLSHFQLTPFQKDHVRKLVGDINLLLKERKLAESILERIFEKWWPDLERDIKHALALPEQINTSRSIESMVEEVLDLTRRLSKSTGIAPPDYSARTGLEKRCCLLQLTDVGAIIAPTGDEWNHPVMVSIGPMQPNGMKEYHEIIITHQGMKTRSLGDKVAVRGVIVEIFFHSEQQDFWSVSFDFHKGITYAKTRMINSSDALEMGLPDRTLWRD